VIIVWLRDHWGGLADRGEQRHLAGGRHLLEPGAFDDAYAAPPLVFALVGAPNLGADRTKGPSLSP